MNRSQIHRLVGGLIVVLFVFVVAATARADCPPEWLPGAGVPGLDNDVYATTT